MVRSFGLEKSLHPTLADVKLAAMTQFGIVADEILVVEEMPLLWWVRVFLRAEVKIIDMAEEKREAVDRRLEGLK